MHEFHTCVSALVPVCTCIHSGRHEHYADFSFQQLFRERHTRWAWVCYMTEQPPHQKVIMNPSCGTALARARLLVLPDGPWRNASSSRAENRHGLPVARQWSQENRWRPHSLLQTLLPGCQGRSPGGKDPVTTSVPSPDYPALCLFMGFGVTDQAVIPPRAHHLFAV